MELEIDLPVIFTSCDGDYADRFLKSYLSSSKYVGIKNNFIIDIIDRTVNSNILIEETLKKFKNVTFIQDQSIQFDSNWPDIKTYYACRRYLILPTLLKIYKRVWTTDIDMIFLRPFELIDKSIAYSNNKLTSNKFDDRKIKADLFYINSTLLKKAVEIKDFILKSNKLWFTDQLALWHVLNDFEDFVELPSNVNNRLEISTNCINPYGLSPGGIQKRKKHFIKEITFFNNLYREIT